MKPWYGYSQEKLENEKIPIVSAKNEFLFDENGKKYLDLISSWWTNIHGHCNEEISQVISEQSRKLDHIMFTDFVHEPAEKLVEKLNKITNNDFAKCFFSDNGSTSAEVALKIAHQHWKNLGFERKNKIIAFDKGYHGDTFGAMSIGKSSGFFKHFEDILLQNVIFSKYPSTWIDDKNLEEKNLNAIKTFEHIINENLDEISCIIIEPLIQGASGMRFSSVEFLEKIVNIAKKADIIVIFDEVMTGFGRTGKMFAYQNTSIVPDIICLSKGLTGGILPLGATCVCDRIYQSFYSNSMKTALLHAHSYMANPISCAVANKSIELFDKYQSLKCVNAIENIYYEIYNEMKNIDSIEHFRIMGDIFAFEIKTDENKYGSNFSREIRQKCLANSINIRPLGNVIYAIPPYCIDLMELKKSFEIIKKILN